MEKWRSYRHSKIYREPKKPASWRIRFSPKLRLSLIVAVIGLGLIWVVFWSPIFAVKTILLQGELTQPVTENLMTLAGRNLFLLSEREITTQLLSVESMIADVHLTRGFPSELRVAVTRRHPALVWQTADKLLAIDQTGVAFTYDSTLADGIPRVADYRGQPINPGDIPLKPEIITFIQSTFTELPSRIGGAITGAEIHETPVSIKFVTEWGWAVYLDSSRPLMGQLENLTLVLRDHRDTIHEYVDMRVEGWAYAK